MSAIIGGVFLLTIANALLGFAEQIGRSVLKTWRRRADAN